MEIEIERELELELELEQPREWLEEHENEVDPGTPTHPTSFQPEQEVYKPQGMSDSPHDVATSHERDALPNANAALDREHPISRYDNGGNAYTNMPTPFAHHEQDPYEVPGPQDDATSLGNDGMLDTGTPPVEPGNPLLDQEKPLTHREWAIEDQLRAELQGNGVTGEYKSAIYPPPPPTPSVRPSQTPNTSRAPAYNYYYPSSLLFPHYRPPRQRREYQPPRTSKTRRERYRPPRHTVDNGYRERGPPPPPNHVNRHRSQPRTPKNEAPTHPSTTLGSERRHLTPTGSWRDRPPHPHPSSSTRRRSDSPNWREARPGRPTSFKCPSSPPADSSTIPQPPSAPPKPTPTPCNTSDLNSLIKQVTSALQSITALAQKLIRRVNAQRRIAHKSQQQDFRCARPRIETCLVHTPHVSSLEGGTCDRVSRSITP
jgi:hypothetical protein